MRCKVTEQSRDPFIDQIAAELKRPVRLDSRFDERVMEALNAPDVIPLHPMRESRRPWIVRPWTLRVSPIGALAAAAALVGVIAFGAWEPTPIAPVPLASPQGVDGTLTQVSYSGEAPVVVHQFTY